MNYVKNKVEWESKCLMRSSESALIYIFERNAVKVLYQRHECFSFSTVKLCTSMKQTVHQMSVMMYLIMFFSSFNSVEEMILVLLVYKDTLFLIFLIINLEKWNYVSA